MLARYWLGFAIILLVALMLTVWYRYHQALDQLEHEADKSQAVYRINNS